MRDFSRASTGTAAVEYGLLLMLVALAIVGSAELLGLNVRTHFHSIHGNLSGSHGINVEGQ